MTRSRKDLRAAAAQRDGDRDGALFEELEPRLLYSAGAEAVLLDGLQQPVGAPLLWSHSALAEPGVRLATEADVATVARHEVVFIDAQTPDFERLVEDLLRPRSDGTRIDVVLLDDTTDGIAQIESALLRFDDLDAVHLITHGSGGAIQLGSDTLDLARLESEPDTFSAWGEALAADGDILIYGCDVAATAEGEALIEALARLTEADVAASDDLTGHASLGGDWQLEYTTGSVDSRVIVSSQAQKSWTDVLMTEGTAVWSDGSSTPLTSDWDGSSFGTTGSAATQTARFRIMQGADAPTRDEIIVVGVESTNNVTIQLWDGSTWTDTQVGTVSETYWWGADVAYEQLSGDGIVVWNDSSQAAGNQLRFSVWDGTSWSTAQSIAAYTGAEPQHLKLVSDPGSDAMVLVVNDSSADDYVLVWDGDGWGNALSLDTSGTAESDQTAISVSFEAQSGNAIATYGKNGDANVYYRVWDGSAWSSEAAASAPGGVAGEAKWLVSASDLTSDRIALGVLTSSGEIWLSVWDGSAWQDTQLVETSATGTVYPNVAVAFESSSGHALAAYGENGANTFRYRTWDATGGWSAESSGPNFGSVPNSMTLDSHPTSDAIMLSVQDSSNDLHYVQWNGTSWGTAYELEQSTGENKNQPFVFVYKQDGPLVVRNAVPVNAVPDKQQTAIDVPVVFSGANGNAISVSDVNDTTSTITLSVTSGTLTLATLSGLAFTDGDGTGDTTMTFSGTLVDINAALDGLQFDPGTGYTGIVALQISSDDAGGAGAAVDTIDIEVGDVVNDAPINRVPAAQDIATDGILLFSSAIGTAISVRDIDAGNNAIQVTLSATNGTLNLSGTQGLIFSTGDGTDDGTLTFTGTLADINAALEGMTFVATPGFSGTASVQIVSDDQGNSGPGGALSDTDSVDITVTSGEQALWLSLTGTNGVDSFGNPGLILEDPTDNTLNTTSGTTALGFDIDAFSPTNANVDAVHYVSRDLQIGASGFQLRAGDLILSVDNAESLVGNSATPAAGFTNSLAVDDQHVFVFRPDTPGDYSTGSFAMLLDDPVGDVVVGIALVETDTVVGDETLQAGDFLIVHGGAQTDIGLWETTDVGAGTTSGTYRTLLAGGDANVTLGADVAGIALVGTTTQIGGQTLTAGTLLVTVVSNKDVGSNALPTNQLDIFALDVTTTSLYGPGDVVASYFFEGTDAGIASEPDALALQATNAEPTASDASFTLDENSANGTVVGTVVGSDPDAGDTVHYAITAGNTDGAFTIDAASGQITVANSAALDFETTSAFTLTVAVIDDQGAYANATITIDLNNLDEPGVNDAPENAVPGDQTIERNGMLLFSGSIGTAISISDFDAGSGSIQVTLNATNGSLNLSGTRGLTFSVGTGTADTSMTFTGTLADINDALEGMTFVAAPGFVGAAGVEIITDDLGNTGTGGAQSDTDNVLITVQPSNQQLWLSFADDLAGTGNPDIPSVTAGDVVTFGDITQLETSNTDPLASTTSGTFAYGFNLDTVLLSDGITLASDGDTIVNAVHYVTRDIQVGSNNIQLRAGDVLFSTHDNEIIAGVSYEKVDLLVFRPDATGDYSQGSFFVLIDGSDVGIGNITGISLVEQATTIGGVALNPGEFLLGMDSKEIYRFVAGTLGDVTTGTNSIFIDGNDFSVDKSFGGLHLVQTDTVIGGRSLTAGQLLVSILGEDSAVGNGTAIDVKRQDVFVLNVTSTGIGTSAATAERFFEGLDENLDDNKEAIWAIGFKGNAAPVAADDTFALDENSPDGTVVGSATGSDPEGGTVYYAIIDGNLDGAFAIDSLTGQITVANSAALDFETTPVFTLTVAVMDPESAFDTATITINLNDVNDAPVLDDSGSMTLTTINEDQTGNGGNTVAEIVASAGGDRITDQDAGAVEGIAIVGLDSSNGTWQYSTDGGGSWIDVGTVSLGSALLLRDTDRLRFVPDTVDADAASVTFHAWDQTSGSAGSKVDASTNGGSTAFSTASETATITVTAVNDLPTSANNTVSTTEDTAYVFTVADFGFSDIDGGTLTQIQVTSLESVGSLQLNGVDVTLNQVITAADIAAGNLTFTPAADDNGAGYDSFDFRVYDGANYSASGYTMTVDVSAVNDLPTAANSTVSALEDTAYVFDVADFSFADVDGDTLSTVQITSLESVGSLQLNGIDVALNQVITASDIAAGNLTFTPAANDNGAGYDSFDFRVNDGTAYSASSYTMTVDVAAVNDLPTAASNTVSTAEDTAYVFTVGDFGFSDIDGDSLAQIQVTSLESAGSLQLSGVDVTLNQVITAADIAAGNLTFTPATNDNGAGYDSFDFRVNDGTAYSASSYTMTVDVTAVNDLPTAASNTVSTPEDSAYVFTTADFGFSDIDGDALSQVQVTSLEGVGSLQLNGVDVTLNQVITAADIAAGNLTFTPAANDNGAGYDSFDFRVNDGTAYSASAYTMTVDVSAVNDAPTAASNTVSTPEDTAYVFTVGDFGFSDIDGDSLAQIQVTSLESAGSLQLSGVDVTLNQAITAADIAAGNLTFTPATNDNGAGYDSFDFRVNDGTAYSASSYTMTVDVTAVNDLPTAASNTVSTPEDSAYVFTTADFGFSDLDGDSLAQIQVTSLQSAGSLQLNGVDVTLNQVITAADIAAGNLTFTPAANDNGAGYDSFDFRVNDGTAYSASSYTITVDVSAVNDAPTAANNTVSTPEDTAYVFTVGDFGFSDVDGDSLAQVQITSLESAGSLQLNGVDVMLNQVVTAADIAAGNLTFTPATNDNGAGYDSFDFRVNDGTAYSASSYTMTVDVSAVNDAPTAADNTVSTSEDTAYVFTTADFGFSDVDGDTLTQIEITSLESVGSLQLNGVDVTLNQVITAADIAAGNLTFTPATNDNGTGYDSFDFRANDGTAYSASSYTITVDVSAVNDAPTAANNTVSTPEDTTYVFTVGDFGFSDVDGDTLTQIEITSLESVGSLQLNGVDVTLNQVITAADIAAGNLTFTPATNDNGTGYDSFDFRANDGTVYSASSYTITVDVSAVNDTPTAANNTVSTPEDTTYVFTVGDFGFSDVDGDALSQIQITSLESVGSLQLNGVDVTLNQIISATDIAAGNLTFTPAANDNGAGYDSFDFRVNDGIAYSASSYTMTVDVAAVNDAPTAANNTVSTPEDTTYVFTVGDFGFSDIDGDSLAQIQITSLESAGSLQLYGVDVALNQVISAADIAAGNLTFAPAANDNGVSYDSFDFRVNDGIAYSASSYTMTVDVSAVNDAPTAASNTVSTPEDTAYVFTTADFGFSDLDGDSLAQIQVTSLESAGSLQLNGVDVTLNQVITAADIAAGNLTFTPAANDNGAGYDSFDFRVNDGTAYSASAYTMTVDVSAVNDAPTAANNSVNTPEDTTYVFTVGDFSFSDIDGDTLTQIEITSLESVGSLQLNGVDVTPNQVISAADIAAGNLTFTPAANDNGVSYDSFDFRVSDGTAYSASSYTLTVDVTAVNDPPTAASNTVSTAEDTAYVFTVSDFGFSDIDGDALSQVQVTSLEGVGSLQLNGVDVTLNQVISAADIAAGNLTFTPAANDNGAGYDSFDFRVNDGTAYSSSSYTMTVDVAAVNDAPTAANNTVSTPEDTAYVFTTADFGFSDIDGDSLAQIQVTSLESAGSLQLSGVDVTLNQVVTAADIAAGNLTFTPATNDNGAGYDSFDFRVNDGTAYSASAYTMTVDVSAVNDAPTAANNSVNTPEDTTYVFTVGDFSFSDVDGDTLTQIEITSLEAVGSLQLNGVDVTLNQVITAADIAAGNLTFTPATNDNGTGYDSFDFRANDGTAYSASSYTITVDVSAVNDAPTAANNSVNTPEDTTYVFTVGDFSFSDIDGDTLTQIEITSLESVGSLQLNGVDVTLNQVITAADIAAGNLTFTPATNDNGVSYDSFDFRVNDGTAYSASSYTMTVDVTAVNDLPTAANNTVSTPEDTAYVFTVGDFDFSDIDGDALSQVQVTSLEGVGSLQLNGVDVTLNQVITAADIAAGNLTFTPATNDNGAGYDSFDFRVNDGTAYSASAYTMTVDVSAVNDAPTAANNTVSTPEDTTYVFTVGDFSFSDIDGDTLTQIEITSLESVGSLQLNAVDVTLNQVISAADIAAGNLTFTPAANDSGVSYDSFDFRVSDGTAYSASSYTLTVDVTAVNDPPTAASNTVSTAEDTAYVFTVGDFGFSDVDGDALSQIQITSLESAGSLQLNGVDVMLNQVVTAADIAAGNLTFTPATNDNGAGYDSFDFRVNDGTAYSASSYTMTVDVSAVNDAPTAADNTVSTSEDTAYVFTTADFGFSDLDGDSLAQIQVTSLESAGSLQLNGVDVTLNQVITAADIAAGNLTFTPATNDNGTGYDSFDFRVNDGTAYSASSYTMTVDVSAVNDAPTAANNTVSTPEDTAYVFTVGDFGFSDIDGDTLTQIEITSLESVGSLQLNGVDVTLNQVISAADIAAGNLTFTPAANDNGVSYDSFDFRVNDGTAYSTSSYTMTVDVSAVNDAPTAANNTVSTPEDTAYVFTVGDFGFSDIDGDALSQVQVTSLEGVGSLQLNGVDVTLNQVITAADIAAGNLTFTPATNDNGAGYDSFDFRVNDGTAYSASSYTMTVDVAAVNDLPTAASNTVSTAEDTAYVFTVGDFGFSDIDGDSLAQIQVTSLESAGSLQLSGVDVTLNQVITAADIAAGNLTFTPATNDNGAGYDSFDFRVNDGTAYSASSYTMTVDVTAVNDLPTAASNTVSTPEDSAYVFTTADFGFSDIDGDSLAQIQVTSLASAGSLQLNGVDVTLNQVITAADIAAGNLTFTPAANDNGAGYDSFDFRVNDGTAYSASAYTMTVDVSAVNDAPTAASNTVSTPEDTAYVFTVGDFGFSDIDGDSLSQVQVTSLEGVGSLQLNGVDVTLNQVITAADIAAGNLTFTPATNDNGAGYDSFDFRVNDGTAYSASAYTMTVDVSAVNDAPTAANNTVSTPEDTIYVFTAADFGFSDIDGDSLAQIQITSLESTGSLQLSGVDVTLNQVVTAADIAAGNLTFTPATNDNGTGYDSFDFRVNDGTAYSSSSYTMTVDVAAVNDPPTAASNTVSTAEDTAYVFTVSDFGFSDIDGDALSQVQVTSLEGVGSLQLNGVDVTLNQVISAADIAAGNLTFTPATNDNGAGYDSFDFRVNDGTAYSASSYTMTVDVTAVNDLPTAASNTVSTAEDTAYVFTVGDFGFSDVDGDSLAQIQITSLESAGSLQLNGVDVALNQVISAADIAAGNLTFAPAANDNGVSYDSFDFRVNDGIAYSASSYTMTVDVSAVNDAPTAASNTVSTPEDTAYVFTTADFGFSDLDGDSLAQIQVTSLESAGSLQLNGVDVTLNQVITAADIAAGNLTFTPAANDNGAGYDSFDFRVNDGTAYSASSYTMTVDVAAVNDAPTAANNTVSTPEDTAYVFTTADFGFSDVDGDTLTQIEITSLESVGSLQLNGVDVTLNQVITAADIAAGNLTFTPAANDNGAGYDSFDFRVNDGTAYSASSYTMTVDVAAVNDAPTAASNTVSTPEDTTYVFTVGDFGFSDIDGDSLAQIEITSLESAGSLQLSGVDVTLNQVITAADIAAGNLTFTPATDDNGAGYDSFDFRVNDGTAYSASSYTMTVDVTAVNDLPTAASNTVSTAEDTAYVFTVGDFGFSDIDGDSLAQIEITSLESAGSLQLSGVDVTLNQVITAADIAAGNLTFTPAANDNGAGYDSFDFRVNDGTADSASSYTVTVNVSAVNDAPTAASNTVSTPEDTAYVFTVGDFGFSDVDGDALSQIQITSLESVGSLQLSGVDVTLNQVISAADIAAGNLTFTPVTGGNGADYDSFDFRVNDGTAYSALIYTITVDVGAVNDLPTAADNTIIIPEDNAFVFTVADFGFSDTDGDSLAQIQITSLESAGSLQLSGVDVTLNQVISATDIAAGNLTFTPATNDNGAGYDSFDFRVNDGTAYSASSYTMTVDVAAVNDLPTAASNTVSTAEDTAYVFTVGDFGFSDVDGDTLTQIEITSLESVGALQLNGVDVTLNQVVTAADIAAGNLTFTPATNDNGAGYDSFDFRVNDGTAYSASSYTMTVDVSAVNDLPTATNSTVITPEETQYVFTVADFNFGDADGDTLAQIRITSLASSGSLQLNGVDVTQNQVVTAADIAAGNLTFAPAANDNGAGYDSFDFRVNDGTAYSASAYTMTVDVLAVNDAPTAASNAVSVLEDTAYVFTAADFGFSDIDGDSLTQIQITSLESLGSLQLNGVDVALNQIVTAADIAAGTLTFTPAANDNGASYDSFGFRVNDGTAYSASSYTMTVDVNAANDRPIGFDSTVNTFEDTDYVFSLSDFGFADIDGDQLAQIQVVSIPGAGSLQLSGIDVAANQVVSAADIAAGNLTFSPASNDSGAGYASFGFRVNDGTAYSSTAYSMNIDVTPVNDAPTAANNVVTTLQDTDYIFGVDDFDFQDVDGDSIAYVRITDLANAGTFQLAGNDVVLNQLISAADIATGNLVFSPDAGELGGGYAEFGFVVSDGVALSASSYRIGIDVLPLAVDPVAVSDLLAGTEDTTMQIDTADLTDNDSVTPGSGIAIASVGQPQNGTLTTADDGSYVYTPDSNFFGTDSFSYTIVDEYGQTATAVVTIELEARNDAPRGADDRFSATTDASLVIDVAALLANDTDVDGDALDIVDISGATFGTVIDNGDGTLVYVPLANRSGLDSFTYTVADSSGATSTAIVYVALQDNAEPDVPDGQLDQDAEPSDAGSANDHDAASEEERAEDEVDDTSETAAEPESPTSVAALPGDFQLRFDLNDTITARGSNAGPSDAQSAFLMRRDARISVTFAPDAESVSNAVGLIRKVLLPAAVNPAMLDALDNLLREVSGASDGENGVYELVVGTIKGTSSAALLGAVYWILRGGALASALFGSLPVWMRFDPMPVLAAGKRRRKDDEDEESIAEQLDGRAGRRTPTSPPAGKTP